MKKRMLLTVVCALLALPLALEAQKKKNTYHMYWYEEYHHANVVFLSRDIVTINTDRELEEEDYIIRSENQFLNRLSSVLSLSDAALIDSGHVGVQGAHSSEMTLQELAEDRLSWIESLIEEGVSVYSVDFQYTPREGETVTHHSPLPAKKVKPYTKGILTASTRTYTQYLYGVQVYESSKVVFVSRPIAEVTSKSKWSEEDYENSVLDFGDYVFGAVSDEDHNALGGSSDDKYVQRYPAGFGVGEYTLGIVYEARTTLIKGYQDDGYTVYYVDYEYVPKTGEKVENQTIFELREVCAQYTRGIIAANAPQEPYYEYYDDYDAGDFFLDLLMYGSAVAMFLFGLGLI